VDVVDTSTEKVLATARYEGEIMVPLPGGYAYTRREDVDGYVKVDIWKLELRMSPRPTR
jgi:hypothetical protein